MKNLNRELKINSKKISSSIKRVLNGSERYLVLEVGNHTTKMIEFVLENELIKILKGFVLSTPAGIINDGIISNISELVPVLEQKMKDEHIINKNLIISLSSSEIITREMVVPRIKPEELDKFILANSTDIFPVKLNTYSLGYSVIEEFVDKAVEMSRIMIAAIPNTLITPYINLATELKLNLVSFNFAGYEIYNFVDFEMDDKDNGYMIIDIGAENTNLAIVHKGILKFNRSLNKGSKEITEAIMQKMKCNLAKAEQLKKQYNSVLILGNLKEDADVYTVAKINQEVITDIMQDIVRIIDFYNANNAKAKIQKVYLTGLGSKISGLEEFVGNILGFDTVRMKELNKVIFEGESKRLRTRQLSFVKCIGAVRLGERKFKFIQSTVKLPHLGILVNPLFYKIAACIILIFALVPAIINFRSYFIKEKIREYNAYIDSNTEITALQNAINSEKSELEHYQSLNAGAGFGAETFVEDLQKIEAIIKDMSDEVKIRIDRYAFTRDTIQIACVAIPVDGVDEAIYVNSPYDFRDRLSEYFDWEGRNLKPEDFTLTLTVRR